VVPVVPGPFRLYSLSRAAVWDARRGIFEPLAAVVPVVPGPFRLDSLSRAAGWDARRGIFEPGRCGAWTLRLDSLCRAAV